jgi:glucose-specific phosphotransferase system IIA component
LRVKEAVMDKAFDLLAPMDGWISPLGDVPDDAFASGLLGPGLAIDPVSDTVHAPADAEVLAVHAAGHAVTLRLAPGLDLLLHFGLETVRLGGAGFTPLVKVGEQVKAGQALLRVDIASVVARAKSLVMPIILIEAEGWQWQPAIEQGMVAKGRILGRIIGHAQSGADQVMAGNRSNAASAYPWLTACTPAQVRGLPNARAGLRPK